MEQDQSAIPRMRTLDFTTMREKSLYQDSSNRNSPSSKNRISLKSTHKRNSLSLCRRDDEKTKKINPYTKQEYLHTRNKESNEKKGNYENKKREVFINMYFFLYVDSNPAK